MRRYREFKDGDSRLVNKFLSEGMTIEYIARHVYGITVKELEKKLKADREAA